MADIRKALWGALGALLALVSHVPPLFGWLAFMSFLDVLSGAVGAGIRGEPVTSTALGRGGLKKLYILMLLAAMGSLREAIGLDVDLASMLAAYFCIVEAISIVENAARAGLPIPSYLTRTLGAMKEQADPKTDSPAKGDQ